MGICVSIKQSFCIIFALTFIYVHDNITRCLVLDTYSMADINRHHLYTLLKPER